MDALILAEHTREARAMELYRKRGHEIRAIEPGVFEALRVFEEWHSEEVLHHSGGRVPMSHIKPNGTRKRF
jgi:hypothetical protein